MNIIWAPWRMSYLTEKSKELACFLCLPENFTGPDRERLLLYSDDTATIFMNLYPYNPGHLLIAPRRHISDLAQSNAAERLTIMDLAAKATDILSEIMKPGGFNMGINQGRISGGSHEEHLHFHVTPRFQGDSNFMAVLGETRIISEHLLATYDKLAEYFNV